MFRNRNADADELIKRLMQIFKAYYRARFKKFSSTAVDKMNTQQALLFRRLSR